MTPEKVIVALNVENAALREREQDLEARLDKDRYNISKRPSSDGLTRQNRSLQCRSGKRPSRQIGHRGETLRLLAVTGEVAGLSSATCTGCQTPLEGQAPNVAIQI